MGRPERPRAAWRELEGGLAERSRAEVSLGPPGVPRVPLLAVHSARRDLEGSPWRGQRTRARAGGTMGAARGTRAGGARVGGGRVRAAVRGPRPAGRGAAAGRVGAAVGGGGEGVPEVYDGPQGPYGSLEERLADRRAWLEKHRKKGGKSGVRAWIASWKNRSKKAAPAKVAAKPAAKSAPPKKKAEASVAPAPAKAAADTSDAPDNVKEARGWIARWKTRSGKPAAPKKAPPAKKETPVAAKKSPAAKKAAPSKKETPAAVDKVLAAAKKPPAAAKKADPAAKKAAPAAKKAAPAKKEKKGPLSLRETFSAASQKADKDATAAEKALATGRKDRLEQAALAEARELEEQRQKDAQALALYRANLEKENAAFEEQQRQAKAAAPSQPTLPPPPPPAALPAQAPRTSRPEGRPATPRPTSSKLASRPKPAPAKRAPKPDVNLNLRGIFSSDGTKRVRAGNPAAPKVQGKTLKVVSKQPTPAPATPAPATPAPDTPAPATPVPKPSASSGGFNLRGLFSSGGTKKVKTGNPAAPKVQGKTVKMVSKQPTPAPATPAPATPAPATPAPKPSASSGGFNLRGLFSSGGTKKVKAGKPAAPKPVPKGKARPAPAAPARAAAPPKAKSGAFKIPSFSSGGTKKVRAGKPAQPRPTNNKRK